DLVGFAWAGFGASFGPIVLLSLFWKRLSNWGALSGLVAGAVVAYAWGQSALSDTLYEIVPGVVANLVVAVVVSRLTFKADAEISTGFAASAAAARGRSPVPLSAAAAPAGEGSEH